MAQSTLVVNCGSSSLKLAVVSEHFEHQAQVLVERLDSDQPSATGKVNGKRVSIAIEANSDYSDALATVIRYLESKDLLTGKPRVIGHRVVHGGENFSAATVIDETVIDAISACSDLAPLHNPINLIGIKATRKLYPDVPQVAVFDTAFHQTLPSYAYLYALPRRCYQDWGVRRYGFHGTSHAYMLKQLAEQLEKPAEALSLISAHLGNGCSITAIEKGQSRDTSMGLTPLEGLVMGTRSGDVDPGLFDFLQQKGLSRDSISRMLNRESGLLGLSGKTNDMRSIVEARNAGSATAKDAIDVFCFRLARYIGAMMASLTRIDGLVFTGGIGENSSIVREQTIAHLQLLGFTIDQEKNAHHGRESGRRIDSGSGYPIYVIPTDEESMIAREAVDAAYPDTL
ncbi:acetate/propionate family kinase [Marinobacter sp. 1Y8]